MNKILIRIAFIILFFSILFQIVNGCRSKQQITFNSNSFNVLTQKEIVKEKDRFGNVLKFTVNYPVIKTHNKNIEFKINRIIQEKIISCLENTQNKAPVSINFDITYKTPKILSIKFDGFYHNEVQGASHGIPFIDSITFNMNTGNLLYINDLFKKNKDYSQALNQLIVNKIKEINFPAKASFKGINKNEKFYLTSKGLEVYYQVYKYTCYSDGPLIVKVPFSKLPDFSLSLNPFLLSDVNSDK